MYKDLSLKEKAKVLQYGGKLGLTSVEDIAKLYDEAISHKFAEGSMATPDWDPNNPYHYHTANGEKVVITPEDWERHKGQPYFKQIEDAVLAEQVAHPGPEYIINPKFSEDLRRVYKGNMGPKYQNYSSFSGNLPQGYSFTPEGLIQDDQGNLYIQKGFRQSPRFTYDESNPLTFPVLEGKNQGNVTFYPVNMEKTYKKPFPVDSYVEFPTQRVNYINSGLVSLLYPELATTDYKKDHDRGIKAARKLGYNKIIDNYEPGQFNGWLIGFTDDELKKVKQGIWNKTAKDWTNDGIKTVAFDGDYYDKNDWFNPNTLTLQDVPTIRRSAGWGNGPKGNHGYQTKYETIPVLKPYVKIDPLIYNGILPNEYENGGPIVSPYGQWKYPGRDTIIPSNDITMDNVNYPVLGISDAGDAKVMMPWNDYKFRGSMVYEHPLVGHSAQDGKKFNKKWKALDNIQYNVYPDTTFTRKKTGVGDIDIFDKTDSDTLTYPNEYSVINPYPGQNTIIYNPKVNDKQDIRLDALHFMPQDEVYDALNAIYRYYASGDVYEDAKSKHDKDIQKYGFEYMPLQRYMDNEADAKLRNHLIQGSREYIESKNYYPDKQQLRKDDYFLVPYIDEIQKYLETGERPKYILPEVVIPSDKYKKVGHLFQGNLSSYMNDSQLENARGIWNYLVGQKGLTQRNAAAIMGNVMQESGLNPNAKNPKSSAKGYFQMLDSKRKDYDKWLRNNPHSKDYGEFDYYVHLIDDVVDPYMDGYNSFMKRWDDVKKAYEAKPSDRNRQSMQEYQDYYDRMYRQRVENNRLFPVIDFNRAWNNYELPLNEITPLFEETFERAGEGSEHEKRNNYAQDFYDYFYDPDINRQETFNWENNRHMQKRISPVPADFRLPNRPLAQSAQLPTDIYLNEMMLDMPSYNQLMYHEKPQGYFFSNGGIHIKPENRGKFTRLKKRTGHSASWFKAHGTPAQRKMATFELNSRHWNKHALGGYLEGGIYDLPEEEIKRLISLGYEVEYL